MTAAMVWLAARVAGLFALGRAWRDAPRLASTGWGLGVGAVAAGVAIAVGWIALAIHDVNLERRTTTACISKAVADAHVAEARALRKAVSERDQHIERAAIRQFAVEQAIINLETEKKELRDALATTAGDGAVVFDVGDRWLQGRAGAAAAEAGGGRPGGSALSERRRR